LIHINKLSLGRFLEIVPSAGNMFLIVVSALCVFLGLILMAIRLRLFLRLQDFEIPFAAILNLTLIGSLVGTILPGPVGGDVAKGGFLWMKVSSGRGAAIGALLVDRVVGLYSLLLLGAFGMLIMLATSKNVPMNMVFFLIPIGAILGAIFLAVGSTEFARTRIFPGLLIILPTRVSSFVEACLRCLAQPWDILYAIALSLMNHVLVLVSFVVAARLIGNSLPISQHFGIDPIAMTLNAIPITPGGIGVAEASFSFLFQVLGSGDGAFIGLLGRSIQYFVFIIAGVPALLSVLAKTGQKFSRETVLEE
ncbi:MAG: lysylphosphatidylglycerol synthase transmembrane domain-containing protein, partial [Desulfomonilaceae bacterium]